MDDFYAYVVMEALGMGSYDSEWPGHDDVINTVPEEARNVFIKTEEYDDNEDWGVETKFPSTKWVAAMNREQWSAFREHMNIEPDRVSDTMGMITEYGHMWALCDEADGMDWNMGGVTPVSFVQTYFCCQDQDILERVS